MSDPLREKEKIRARTYLLVRVIVLIQLVILGIQITDITYSNVQRSALYELASQEREFITSGFFPKLMDAMRKSFEEQHHGPLHNILGAIGDGVSSLFGFGSSNPKAIPHLEIEENVAGRRSKSQTRGKRSIVSPEPGEIEDGHLLKYELFDLVEKIAKMYLNESSEFYMD